VLTPTRHSLRKKDVMALEIVFGGYCYYGIVITVIEQGLFAFRDGPIRVAGSVVVDVLPTPVSAACD